MYIYKLNNRIYDCIYLFTVFWRTLEYPVWHKHHWQNLEVTDVLDIPHSNPVTPWFFIYNISRPSVHLIVKKVTSSCQQGKKKKKPQQFHSSISNIVKSCFPILLKHINSEEWKLSSSTRKILIRNRFLIAKKQVLISNFINSLGCHNSLSSLLKIDLSNVFLI